MGHYHEQTATDGDGPCLSFTRSNVPPWKHTDQVSSLRLPVAGRSPSVVVDTNSRFAAASTASIVLYALQHMQSEQIYGTDGHALLHDNRLLQFV